MKDYRTPADARAKAERWLELAANHIERVWDQEALVYLKSRGRHIDCGRTFRVEPKYWDRKPISDYSFAPVVFRTIDWCDMKPFSLALGGFLEGVEREPLLQDFMNPQPTWLFNMARSDYAIELMPEFLNRYLEGISTSAPDRPFPWIPPGRLDSDGVEQQVSYASAIVFGQQRLPSARVEAELVRQAVDTICSLQNNGVWPVFTGATHSSIESTAMALHALALTKPHDWPRIATCASDWLWSVQGEDGEWSEPGAPGSAYLTVLVLDAIALANGETKLTFRLPAPQLNDAPAPATPVPDRDSKPEPREIELAQPNDNNPQGLLRCKAARRAAVDAYIQEVFVKTGKQIGRKDIWQAAGYKTRTEFEKWQRCDPKKVNNAAHKCFTQLLLVEKPHLK